jgi:hypothetical protein
MSSASIRTFISSSADGAAAADPAAKKSSRAGSVSWTSRWSVQSPPFSTFDGMPGSGVSEPKAPPPPANWNAVM